MTLNTRTKIGFVASAAAALAIAGAVPAFAEGTYSANFSGANPGFSSHSWADTQEDSNPTKVAYSACAYSNGTPVSSFTVKLWDQHGIWPDATVGDPEKTVGCGSVKWVHGASSYTLNDSTFYWQISLMNGSDSNRWASGGSKATY
jgi:hypothetical protein